MHHAMMSINAALNVRSGSTPDEIADALRVEIARGEPPPGAPLRQEEVAERFGVSRIPVREALRKLEAEGLVVVRANRGAFVRRYDAAEVREIYDLRIMLETDLLRRAVANATRADLLMAEAAMAEAEAQAGGDAWRAFDNRFHAALYAPARRPHQSALVAGLRATVTHYRAADDALPDSKSVWLADHYALLDACKAGDADRAAEILRTHLDRAAAMTIERLNAGSRELGAQAS